MSLNTLPNPTDNIQKEINTQKLDLLLNDDNNSIIEETKISPITENIVKPIQYKSSNKTL